VEELQVELANKEDTDPVSCSPLALTVFHVLLLNFTRYIARTWFQWGLYLI